MMYDEILSAFIPQQFNENRLIKKFEYPKFLFATAIVNDPSYSLVLRPPHNILLSFRHAVQKVGPTTNCQCMSTRAGYRFLYN